MIFRSLKMAGFKSFAESAEVEIDSGLTGIVGPNGCGKSNIVEGLRWVMGESSARQMRGGEMDDVIFGGTEQRPARNLAEITLQLDNRHRQAPAEFNDADELEITRKIERGKGSSYYVNAKPARARDVQLLFADTATGARSSGIVSQGRIGAIVGAKPVDRRTLIEEAANIRGLLDLAQRQSGGWLLLAAMDKVAKYVGCAPMRVYEVATFYTMFNREQVGTYFIQLCGTTPCMVCGSEAIKKSIEDHLGIKEGETSKDGLFTLREVECLGACANAPMIQMNDDYYECLTPKSVVELLEACKRGEKHEMGRWGSLPMNGQVSCEGPRGKTSLGNGPPAPYAMREDLKGEVDPASVKAHMGY